MEEVTKKQRDFINEICDTLKIEFTGKTKSEATQFISSNIEEFKTKIKEQQQLDGWIFAIQHENAGDRD